MKWAIVAAAAALTACATTPVSASADRFMTALHAHCGRAYEGRLVTNDPADASFAGKRLVMHVRECSADEVRIPFHVGSDRSRTWIVTRTAGGLRLKHDHRHEDGSPDELTMYGGDTETAGTAARQEFPADTESIALFTRAGRSVSNTNVWAMEIHPAMFAYELRRPPMPGGRSFRVEFDLTKSVEPPPAPWGY